MKAAGAGFLGAIVTAVAMSVWAYWDEIRRNV